MIHFFRWAASRRSLTVIGGSFELLAPSHHVNRCGSPVKYSPNSNSLMFTWNASEYSDRSSLASSPVMPKSCSKRLSREICSADRPGFPGYQTDDRMLEIAVRHQHRHAYQSLTDQRTFQALPPGWTLNTIRRCEVLHHRRLNHRHSHTASRIRPNNIRNGIGSWGNN